jgi:elongation factor G
MSNYATENIRTVALVGHGGSGKTSLVEAMLVRSGALAELGSVEKGNTVCDNDPQEKQVGHSLRMAVAHIDTAMPDLTPVRIHVIDTPGYPDYVGQSLAALDAVKSVAVVVDATKGIELMTRRMMQWAKERNLCRMIVVNKIDAPDVNCEKILEELREAFGDGVLPINLPTKGYTRVIDCFDKDEGEADFMSVSEVHRAFIERVVEVDDETMEKYLEEGENALEPHNGNPYAALHTSKSLSEVERLRLIVAKQEVEIARLKKGYWVEGAGANKEYVTGSGKTTKSSKNSE